MNAGRSLEGVRTTRGLHVYILGIGINMIGKALTGTFIQIMSQVLSVIGSEASK